MGQESGNERRGVAGLLQRLKSGLLIAAALAGLGMPAALAAQEPAAAGRAGIAATARPPRPAIWLIEDEDTKIYLFGTVHVFPAALQWRSAALERVIAEADELVMETPDASAAEMGGGGEMAIMQMGKSVPILERVSPQVRPLLQAALEATPMPIDFYDQLHTWAVAFLLTGFQIAGPAEAQHGVTALSGAEDVLGQLFRKRRRPISGVETTREQIAIFANMPVGAQRRFLESTVTSGEPAGPQADDTSEKWARGDVDSIAAEMLALPAELYETLLTRRNRSWTAWLVRRMDRPGTVLFAVGAGHLAGDDSVQAMLAEQGVRARRID